MIFQPPQKNIADTQWRILLIDGDEDDFILIRDMLKEAKGRSVELDWASTYEAGQTKLAKDEYDAILVDNDLGARRGVDLIRTASERGFSVPLILFTGRGSYEEDIEAMRAGATLYMSKNELSPLSLERFIRYAIERKQAEIALEVSERQSRELIQYAPSAIYEINLQTRRFTAVNDAMVVMAGYSREELLQMTAYDLVEEQDHALLNERMRQWQSGQTPAQTAEYRIRTKDGRLVDAGIDIAFHLEENGRPLSATVIAHDITERKQAEQVLRESEKREQNRARELAAILDAVPAYIWITRDPDSRQMSGNRATYELLRSQPRDNLSESAPEPEYPRQFRAMRDGKEISPEELPVQTAAATCRPVEDYEFDIVFDDGSSRRLRGNAAPLCNEEGHPAGAVGAFIDITELRKIEQETSERTAMLEVQGRLLEHREMERSQLAHDLHDGPIQSLGGLGLSLQMLQSLVENQEAREMLEQLEQDVRNLAGELRGIYNELRPPG